MNLRWIIRNGEKVLQQEVNRTHSTLAEDTIWQDVPLETNHEWSEIEEKKESKFKGGSAWKTREGKKVIILNNDNKGCYPIHAYFADTPKCFSVWMADGGWGRLGTQHDNDLVEPWPEEENKSISISIGQVWEFTNNRIGAVTGYIEGDDQPTLVQFNGTDVSHMVETKEFVRLISDVPEEEEMAPTWKTSGEYGSYDIPEKEKPEKEPIKVERWVNIYEGGYIGVLRKSRADADYYRDADRIACIKISGTAIKVTGTEGVE